jgi:hypothetical protein
MLGNRIALLPPIKAGGEAIANNGRGIFLSKSREKIQQNFQRISVLHRAQYDL